MPAFRICLEKRKPRPKSRRASCKIEEENAPFHWFFSMRPQNEGSEAWPALRAVPRGEPALGQPRMGAVPTGPPGGSSQDRCPPRAFSSSVPAPGMRRSPERAWRGGVPGPTSAAKVASIGREGSISEGFWQRTKGMCYSTGFDPDSAFLIIPQVCPLTARLSV